MTSLCTQRKGLALVLFFLSRLYSNCLGELIVQAPKSVENLTFNCYNAALTVGKQDWKNLTFKPSSYLSASRLTHQTSEVELIPTKVVFDFSQGLRRYDEFASRVSNDVNVLWLLAHERNASAYIFFSREGFHGFADITGTYDNADVLSEIVLVNCESDSVPFEELESFARSVLNNSVTIHLTKPQVNPFEKLFESWYYILVFAYVIPVSYVFTAVLGFSYAYERIRWMDIPLRQTILQIPFVVIIIESLACFILGMIFFIDGMWCRVGVMKSNRRWAYFNLLPGSSFCTTALVYIVYMDTVRISKGVSRTGSVCGRNLVGFLMCTLSSLIDIFFFFRPDLSRDYKYQLGIVYSGLTLLYAALFLYGNASVVKVMSRSISGDLNGDDIMIRKRLKHMNKYALITAWFMLLYLLVSVLGGMTHMLKNVTGWSVGLSVANISRIGISVSQITLCRMPNRHKLSKLGHSKQLSFDTKLESDQS